MEYEFGIRYTMEINKESVTAIFVGDDEASVDSIMDIFKEDERVTSISKIKRPVGEWEDA